MGGTGILQRVFSATFIPEGKYINLETDKMALFLLSIK
jgi:hypothetical protein